MQPMTISEADRTTAGECRFEKDVPGVIFSVIQLLALFT
jgi:hypothetical protein